MTRKEHIHALALTTDTKIQHLSRSEWCRHPVVGKERNKIASMRNRHVGWNAAFIVEDNLVVTAAPSKRYSLSVYMTLLHELGHANDHDMIARTYDSQLLLVGDEIHAWKWALANAREWNARCTKQLSGAIETYVAFIRKDAIGVVLCANILRDVADLKVLAKDTEARLAPVSRLIAA